MNRLKPESFFAKTYQNHLAFSLKNNYNEVVKNVDFFDKYDFDVILSENGEVSFSYIAQDIDLIYCKNKSPYIDSEEYLSKSIAKDWYVVEY